MAKSSIFSLLVAVILYTILQTTNVNGDGVIVVRGNKMYNSKTGERFFMKGMTYEYAVSDEYYTKYSKEIIEKNLEGLEFNTLRLYNINPSSSYKLFMNDMAKRGIYVLVSASPDNDEYYGKYRYSTITKNLGPNGKVSLDENGKKQYDLTETCYPALLLEYGKKIAKNFALYDNTLGIVVANEIMQKDLTAAACVKQYVSDLKVWMRVNGKQMRILPLAYAAADSVYTPYITNSDDYHVVKIQGLLCGDTMKNGLMLKSIDIYLINEYRWCPGSSFVEAGYQRYIDMAQGIPIVLGFGEYGCKEDPSLPRDWDMVPYLYDTPAETNKFSEVFSGGYAYSYGEAKLGEASNFPMFTGGSNKPDGQPSMKATPDYTNLKKQFAQHIPYSDPASWSKNAMCDWVPKLATKTQPQNKRATEYGWLLDKCDSKAIIIGKEDTWDTKSREGVVCDDNGGRCTVTVTESAPTTEQMLCGGVYEVEAGGSACTSASDCGKNGQCLTGSDGKTKSCVCLQCYTGADCSQKMLSTCNTLSSMKDAPQIIFAAAGTFLSIMFVVFIGLGVVASKKHAAMAKLGKEMKLRNRNTTTTQASL